MEKRAIWPDRCCQNNSVQFEAKLSRDTVLYEEYSYSFSRSLFLYIIHNYIAIYIELQEKQVPTSYLLK
jgi:hypothetical protein